MAINILTVYPGHNATAALLRDGKVLGIISEERFTRVKNQGGFPKESIKWLLREFNVKPSELDSVAVCGSQLVMSSYDIIDSKSKRRMVDALSGIYGRIEYEAGRFYRPIYKAKAMLVDRQVDRRLNMGIREMLTSLLKVPEEKIEFVEHHTCHAYSAYFGQTEKHEKALVLTLDGEGDDICATVSVAQGNSLRRIAKTNKHHSIGYVYSLTTSFMGMTPLEHEYKVMGLAPYAATKEQKYFMKTYDKVFKDVVFLDRKNPLVFKSRFPTNRFLYWLKEKAVGERFDNLAGALQHFTEELVSKWVVAAVKKTGCSTVYCGGGVFMNVKMNMLLAQLPQVKMLNVFPSCGDESNPIGAGYYSYLRICNERKIEPNTMRVKDLYLGPDLDREAEEYVRKKNLSKKYIVRKAEPKLVAGLLANGEVIARSAGRMEWGARSLGNRCIMANPSDLKYVWQINEQIKMRDFWMPFAPSILPEREKDYIRNPKHIPAPYMIMAFDSTPLGVKELRAAMHQADFTLRPQVVYHEWNQRYYDIIKEFEKLTGIGGVLNTSFNLHGKPIVMTPKDAVEEVFEHSGLKHLIIGDFLISKKE